MSFVLHDTLTRSLRPVRPGDGHTLRFYCCGPTVYAPAHIGNLRTFILQDVFRRTAEASGLKVRHVRNLTDVDDKTIRAANAAGISLKAFTSVWIDRFRADTAALNLLPPTVEPAATDHIEGQIQLIVALLEHGHAYRTEDGSVYFKVTSFPSYGKLSRLDERELRPSSAEPSEGPIDADEYTKEDRSDFALWKGRKPEDGPIFWSAPWGEGRPGWHLECSAMSMAALGSTLDVHGGGVDLIFPHHENEIAQSEACTGQPFVRHWFHCAHLMVENTKMSKSLGNLYTLEDLQNKGFAPLTVRFLLLSAHYRSQLNFTFNGLHAAEGALGKMAETLQKALQTCGLNGAAFIDLARKKKDPQKLEQSRWQKAWKLLRKDLNTAGAWGEIMKQRTRWDKEMTDSPAEKIHDDLHSLATLLYAFGLETLPEVQFGHAKGSPSTAPIEVPETIQSMAEERWKAKQSRDFATADRLRNELMKAGWEVKDSKDGFVLTPR